MKVRGQGAGNIYKRAAQIGQTIKNFCHSAELELELEHVPSLWPGTRGNMSGNHLMLLRLHSWGVRRRGQDIPIGQQKFCDFFLRKKVTFLVFFFHANACMFGPSLYVLRKVIKSFFRWILSEIWFVRYVNLNYSNNSRANQCFYNLLMFRPNGNYFSATPKRPFGRRFQHLEPRNRQIGKFIQDRSKRVSQALPGIEDCSL